MQSSMLTHAEIRQRSHDKTLVGLFELKDKFTFFPHALFTKQAACTFLPGSEFCLISQKFPKNK
jgi:hypothetical protein